MPKNLRNDPKLFTLLKEIRSNQFLPKRNIEGFSCDLIRFEGNVFYLGFCANNKPNGLGIIYEFFDTIQIKQVGVFTDGLLNGLGVSYYENYILNGEWRNGEFIHGLYYEEKANKYVFGSFFKNKCFDVIKEGEGFPIDLLSSFILMAIFHIFLYYFSIFQKKETSRQFELFRPKI